ncbi:hypothetical protein K449DRAFT_435455 [Hypoxylon sp. EC38]|nr:hypothetical protein K449DRAFT_435455 [Hypoxylon sp. EC38]
MPIIDAQSRPHAIKTTSPQMNERLDKISFFAPGPQSHIPVEILWEECEAGGISTSLSPIHDFQTTSPKWLCTTFKSTNNIFDPGIRYTQLPCNRAYTLGLIVGCWLLSLPLMVNAALEAQLRVLDTYMQYHTRRQEDPFSYILSIVLDHIVIWYYVGLELTPFTPTKSLRSLTLFATTSHNKPQIDKMFLASVTSRHHSPSVRHTYGRKFVHKEPAIVGVRLMQPRNFGMIERTASLLLQYPGRQAARERAKPGGAYDR